jgi:hypothetical protein
MRIASITASLVLLGFVASGGASAAEVKKIDCEMKFSMSGWSAFYKTASGTGLITCDNGQSLAVKLTAKGGGLTFGKSSIEDGHGEFSEVHSLDELLGAYASAEAHAGAVKSTQAEAMTKGEVSLALTGKGRGWDLGIAFGKLVISR